MWLIFVIGSIIGFLLLMLMAGLKVVNQATVKIIERLGKYHKTMEPGIGFIVPFCCDLSNESCILLLCPESIIPSFHGKECIKCF